MGHFRLAVRLDLSQIQILGVTHRIEFLNGSNGSWQAVTELILVGFPPIEATGSSCSQASVGALDLARRGKG